MGEGRKNTYPQLLPVGEGLCPCGWIEQSAYPSHRWKIRKHEESGFGDFVELGKSLEKEWLRDNHLVGNHHLVMHIADDGGVVVGDAALVIGRNLVSNYEVIAGEDDSLAN